MSPNATTRSFSSSAHRPSGIASLPSHVWVAFTSSKTARVAFCSRATIPCFWGEQAVAALRRRKMAIVARVAVAWGAVREFFEEKTEAVLGEPIEVLAHIAPQIAPLV